MFGRRSLYKREAPLRAPAPAVAITNFRGVTEAARKTVPVAIEPPRPRRPRPSSSRVRTNITSPRA